MSHYKSNLRDIEFNLFELFNTQEHLGSGPFAEFPAETAQMLLKEVDRFSRESVWADSFEASDRIPLELSADGDITVPDALHDALQAYYEAGWHTLPLPTNLGGFGAPPSMRWATTELFFGGNATAQLWPIGSLMSMIIDQVGTEGQKALFAQNMVDKQWGGTMVLTEPDAGSDVGAGTTKAVKVEDNGDDDLGSVWHLEGVKRFITSADYQGHENTVHLVLARPEGGIAGTKGLRLFIVPKYLVNSDGSLGERNGVRVSNIEKKMGIKGSATCELTMGDREDQPCVGYLVGDADVDGAGIKQMFLVIEYARMSVGTKAMATLSTGYLNALEYAKIRQQGPDMTQMADAEAPKVTIINHPDVRRLLMEQKAHAEGMRALVMFTGWIQDQAALESDPDGHKDWIKREDLMLPMVKGYCSEKAYELLAQSLQVFGGSGFTQDYPIEQYIRDAKIDTLYEGTTAIQSLDLFFRKIARDNGVTLMWLAEQIKDVADNGPGELVDARKALGSALDAVQGHLGKMVEWTMAGMQGGEQASEIYKTGLQSVGLLNSLSEVVIGWLLLRQAAIASAKLEAGELSDDERNFYEGKVAVAQYWGKAVLPKVALRTQLAQAEDGSLMDVPESVF